MGICLWESCVWPACQSLTWPRPLTPSFWHMFFCLMGIPFAHPWAMGAVSTISFICQSVGTEICPESKIYFSHYGCYLKGWKWAKFKWKLHCLHFLAPGRPNLGGLVCSGRARDPNIKPGWWAFLLPTLGQCMQCPLLFSSANQLEQKSTLPPTILWPVVGPFSALMHQI